MRPSDRSPPSISANPLVTLDIARLGAKLQALADRDEACAIFGADTHRYARTPVSDEALVALEAAAGFALPEPYKAWMRQIGSGAGPDHGLWAPEAALAQMNWSGEGRGGRVRGPMDIGESDLAWIDGRLRDGGAPGDACITADSLRGAVPIGRQGCNGYWYLVLAGAFTGCVFGECCDCIGPPWTAAAAFWPAGAPGARPPGFLAWLKDWLDRSLAEAASL